MKLSKKFIVVAVIVVVGLFLMVQFGSLTGNVVGEGKMDKVKLETNKGDIVIELFEDTPVTSGNFKKLVGEGFYDEIKFHRVIDNFMIQGGDPLSKDDSNKARWGTGGSESIKDEFGKVGNLRGTLSMANSGPNTGSSQFFINLVDNNFLDGKHAVFGKVVEGMEVVDAIAKVGKNAQDQPLENVVILKASVL